VSHYIKILYPVYEFECGVCSRPGECDADNLKDAIKEMRVRGWEIGKHKNTCRECRKRNGR